MADSININSLGIFDQEEIFHNCTVQILTNTLTGEVSIGWWPEDCDPIEVSNE